MPAKTTEISYIQTQNPNQQNASQGVQKSSNNLPYDPSISDFNRIIVPVPDQGGHGVNHRLGPAFGTHVREAVAIVKDWVK